MGIPSFYRWLLERYPLSVVDVIEDEPPVTDTSQPNPNGLEFDNLYLDMNGIVHPCFHPEGLPAPNSYDQIFTAVFDYIDRIFSIVRPRKLILLAIDGVAPRAKMNQQRTRRFKAAKEAADEASEKESVFESEEEKAVHLERRKKMDSNVITPGTEFMALLSSALRYYIHLRMNNEPGWKGIKVILSDANVPGEGEHKIMSYIRSQRNLPGYDPNTRHCIYGLDADLIMLALATHEIHFSILREDVRREGSFDKNLKPEKYSSQGKMEMEVVGENPEDYISRQKFQFLHIWILREYLGLDMKIKGGEPVERMVDDFVFMCLFVGNDFLPHIPSLEISEGAIDLLMTVYKEEFFKMGGCLTYSCKVNLKRVEHFVQALASHECAIFRRRRQVQKERQLRDLRRQPVSKNKNISSSSNLRSQNHQNSSAVETQMPIKCSSTGTNVVVDEIKLGETGWKERFYAEKFKAETEDDRERIRSHAVSKYIEGICWVMHYYYKGVCSWQWFYPYHYAPFASDFSGIDQLKIEFTLGKPFKPFDQLLGVLPAARKLMTDMSSPLLDLYPTDFELDMNGKRFSWQAICKLPFIDESRLLSEIAKVEHTLTDEERCRNSFSLDVLFVHSSHPLALKILAFCKKKAGHPKLADIKLKRKIIPKYSGGMNGHMYISDKPVQPVEIYSPIEDMAIISNNEVLSVFFKCPPFHSHIPSRSVGLIVPCKSIRKRDILPPAVLWHEKSAVLGRIHSERSIHKSISGHILAKLAHRLLSKCYPSMHLKKGSMELGDKIGADGLAWPLNVGSTICELGIRADKKSVDNGVPDKQVGETGANGLACFNGVRDNSFIDGKSRKRKWNCVGETGANGLVSASDVPDNHLGAEGLSSFSNLLPTVCEVGSGADKNFVASGVPDNQAGETGANGLVCICLVCAKGVLDKDYFHREYKKESRALFKAKRLRNLEPTIGTGADKICVDNGVQDNHVGEIGAKALTYSSGVPNNHVGGTGAKALTYSSGVPNNLVGETGAKALTYSSGVPNNHVGEMGANGLVCASGVPDNHLGAKGVSCLSNLLPTVCEVGSGADKNCVANGVPDNQVGETGANGKSKKKRRKKSKAKGAQNLEPTIGTGADKNCVDDGVQNNHVGETGAKALTYSSGAPNNHVGETGAKALTYSSGVPNNHVGKTGAKALTYSSGLPNNHVGGTGAKALTYSSEVPNNLVGETGAKALTYSSGVPNNHVGETGANGLVCASGVPDNHLGAKGVSCLSNLLPTVCEVGSGADKNCVANGVPDNQVGETGANGKSKKKRRKKSKAKGAQNLEPTIGTGADKNCVDNGVQNNHVGETGGKALTYSSGVPNNHVGETGAKALTYSSGVPNNHVGANGLVCASSVPDKKFVDVKCKKRKRKQSKVRGAKALTYSSGVPNNHVGETGAKALTYSSGVPNNHVGANGLVCASGVLDKKFVDVKCKKRKRKQIKVRGAQNLERHALPAEVERLCAEVEYHECEAGSLRSKLLRVQQEALEFNYLRAEIGAKASTYSGGVPNNHVGETGAKALTYSGGVPNNQPCW